ncbi:isopeptide-forming domain-containing fimbrial protein [Microbulbifer sp.]|uniref:beta strand repeat-containing protein n=1 Tax=Microbulbifer sp. TaxID=1908541 RepID=UPI002F95330F
MSFAFAQMAVAASFKTTDFATDSTPPGSPGNPSGCLIDGPYATTTDGSNRTMAPADQLSIDRSCTVKNFSCDVPLESTLNFAGVPSGTLIIFDNVCFGGNFACANVEGKASVWAVNGSDFSTVREGCQNLVIPVEKIEKQATDLAGSPITSVSIGVPFVYTLDIPVLFDPVTGTVLQDSGSLNNIQAITIQDDLSAAALGVDLDLLDVRLFYEDTSGATTPMSPAAYSYSNSGNPNSPGVLTFQINDPSILPAGAQIHIELEVVLDNTALNSIGKSFTNTATWEFGRYIDGTFYDPLPGENGVAQLLSISAPDLLLTKTTDATAINFADTPTYTINVQNVGGSPAWNIEIEDLLPVGMRESDPVLQSVTMGGVTLTEGTHFTASYNSGAGAGAGLLTIKLLNDAGALAPNAVLEIIYTSQLDDVSSSTAPVDGDVLSNVAAATAWYNDLSTNNDRIEYTGVRSDGTPGTDDEQDVATVTAALSGYYFEKTVSNVTTGQSPTASAAPGDRLRYRLRLFNLDENIYNVTITDQLDASSFDFSSAQVVAGTCPTGASCTFNAAGLLTVTGDLDVVPGSALSSIAVEFEVNTLSSLNTNDVVSNQARMDAQDADTSGTAFFALSDDPNDAYGVVNQADPQGNPINPTDIVIISPGALDKQNPSGITQVAIGELFEYTILIPATTVPAPLYDVQVSDQLPSNLDLVSANALVNGTSYTLSNTGSANSLVLVEPITGLDIPANQQAEVTVQVRLKNRMENQDTVQFTNTASYTYSRTQGGAQSSGAGTADTTAPLTVVEPNLVATSSVVNSSRGGSTAYGGDVLQYTVALTNNGTSTAYDLSIINTLSAGQTLVPGSAQITLGGIASAVAPGVSGDVLSWGRSSGQELDIPVGGTLTLVYQVEVSGVDGGDLTNSIAADWTSLDGSDVEERTGNDAPDTSALNNYFIADELAMPSVDNAAIVKTVISDTWNGDITPAAQTTARAGDTITYQLTLTLPEGLNSNVVVTDLLDPGLAFVDVVSINGAATAPYAAAGVFSYSDIPAANVPAADQTGTLSWNLGDVTNAPDQNPANDEFVIVYRARVQHGAGDNPAATPTSTVLNNQATLGYTYASGAAATTAPATASVEVLQPQINELTKTGVVLPASGAIVGDGQSAATAYLVDIASNSMQFSLQACNVGDAPAYGVTLHDDLPAELDEGTLNNVAVAIDGAALGAADFSYTAPAARDGEMQFTLNVALAPSSCVTIDYNIGFYTDIAPNQVWSNAASVEAYWSRESLDAADAREYVAINPVTSDSVWMTNNFQVEAPSKTVSKTQATIGEEVVYTITVPGTPVNGVLSGVTVTDTLSQALQYVDATVQLNGAPLAVTTTQSGQDLSWAIGDIPAGQQAVITVTTWVANTQNVSASATPVGNVAAYTYQAGGVAVDGGSSAPAEFTVVEPDLSVVKAVANLSDPGQPAATGDVLEYTLTITNNGDATAFDTNIADVLPAELSYVDGSSSAQIDGSALVGFNATPSISGNTLTWGRDNGDNSVVIPAGSVLVLTYQTDVNTITAADIVNSALVDWTSLSGTYTGDRERTGAGCPSVTPPNIYCSGDTSGFGVDYDIDLQKTRQTDSWNDDGNLRVGDTVDYQLKLDLVEGTHNGLVLEDTLPQGMAFVGVLSADFFGTAATTPPAPSVSADQRTITWDLGTVTNPVDGDDTNDFVTITYRARVLNGDALAQQPTTQALNNVVTLNYLVGSAPGAPLTTGATVNALQPFLTVSKSAVTAINGDTVIQSGEAATYTVDITNTGNAPAYDVVLEDVLPVGLRNAGVSMQSATLVNAGTSITLTPTFDPATGTVTWDFDPAANAAIPAGDTLRVVYQVTGDADLGAGLTLTNSAQVTRYFSFDNDQVPANSAVDWREDYGPSAVATFNLTTPVPGVLSKATTQSTVAIGEQLTYTLTVPEVPADVALQDVRIMDNLSATGVDLAFVSATVVGGNALTNSGTADNLVLSDTSGGLDIPAGAQVEVQVTVEVLNTANNQNRTDPFVNRAWYDYSNGVTRLGDDPATGGDANAVTIVHAELVVEKTGPATIKVGTPENFTLTVLNNSSASAWNVTLTDWLPNPDPGGLCDVQPVIQSAAIQKAGGASIALNASDFAVSFVAGTPTCEFSATLQSDDELAPGDQLIVVYQVALDGDNINDTTLTNIAGATQWFSASAATSERFAYQRTLTDGTPGVVDHEDSHTFTVQSAILEIRKSVLNVTTGQSGANASPGDQLRYSIEIQNVSDVALDAFVLRDELDRLNAKAMFQTGSLRDVSVPAGATASVIGDGGAQGSGLLEVTGLAIAKAGDAGDTITVVFDVDLVPVITSGTVVLNQAQLSMSDVVFASSDDPLVGGIEDPTQTLIHSAPWLKIQKTSQDLTGDADMLAPGDSLRYTLTVENTGSEDAINTVLRDLVPGNTTYVANSTTLNGVQIADVSGSTALASGISIQTPGAESGFVGAAAEGAAPVVITFDVVINDVNDGTLISNQGFANGDGAGSGAFAERPSDDPATSAVDDPTIDIVGDVPLLVVTKTVELAVDNMTVGIVDPEDVLRYTISVTNMGGKDASEARLVDLVPADTTYVANSTKLNGLDVADAAGGSPLAGGLAISSDDLTPPLPATGEGVITSAQTATIVFDVMVNADTARGTIISNQGSVSSVELPLTLTDADGNSSNGAQPTEVVVGDAQQLSITKEVAVVGGGDAESGKVLEYLVRVTNISSVPASLILIQDDLLTAGDGVLTYVADSARVNGQAGGVSVNGSLITVDYSTNYGDLQPGEFLTLRFQARLGPNLAIGTTVVNTAQVQWNDPAMYNEASVSIDIGGTPGIANLSGYLWHDVDFSETADTNELLLSNWTVQLYFNNALLETAQSDANGYFQFGGLVPNMDGANMAGASYELRYLAPNAVGTTASLGTASSDYTNGPQQIRDIYIASGSNPQNLNLPITPNGVIYDSVLRAPVNGARVRLLGASSGQPLPDSCFDDPKQQNQVTLTGGFYKFDVNFSSAACAVNADYLIEVDVPSADYVSGPSQIIPPQTGVDTGSFDVAACLGSAADRIPGTPDHCEVQLSVAPPSIDLDARSSETDYYLRVNLDDSNQPGSSQLFNNHIALDPQLEGALALTKTAAMLNVTRSQLVPYTITFSNSLPVPLTDLQLVDYFPAGFKYVAGSANLDGEPVEPVVNGLQLQWPHLRAEAEQTHSMKLLLVVGSGVGEGEYINRARMFNELSGQQTSGEASATVRVVPDPTFDCTDVIGKVFDDKNLNGYQDAGEGGVPGARVVTANGLKATADAHGRFHITCAAVPNPDRGSNFVLKLDDRSLPSGYRLTTENPRVQRATRGKMLEFNFGTSLHRVVRLDLAEAVFEPGTSELRPQWHSRTELLLERLQEAPSVLRLSYLAENEDPSLVDERLATIKARIAEDWAALNCCYPLNIETEIFWRRGAPPERGNVLDGLKRSVNRMIGSDDQGGAR